MDGLLEEIKELLFGPLYHLYLKMKSDGFTRIEEIFPDRDYVRVGHSLKKLGLDVSDDLKTFSTDFKEFQVWEEKTIYLEFTKSQDALKDLEKFGKIKKIIVLKSFGFLVFKHSKSQKAVLMDKRLVKEYSILSKSDWNQRVAKYLNFFNCPIQKSLRSIDYEPGLIAYFTGVDPDTTPKTLLYLFQLVVPIAFVDFKRGNDHGYIRFNSSSDALVLQSYFSRCLIKQKSPTDSVGYFDSLNSKAHHSRYWNNDQSYPGIKVYILEGTEEEEYWEFLNSIKDLETEEKQDLIEDFNEPQVQFKPRLIEKRKHVVFDDQDDPKEISNGRIVNLGTDPLPLIPITNPNHDTIKDTAEDKEDSLDNPKKKRHRARKRI